MVITFACLIDTPTFDKLNKKLILQKLRKTVISSIGGTNLVLPSTEMAFYTESFRINKFL